MSHAALPVPALPAFDGMCFKGLGGPLFDFVTPAGFVCGGRSVKGSRRKQAGWMDLLCRNRPGLGTEDLHHPFGRRLFFCPCPWGRPGGSLKVHSTWQSPHWLQGPAPPASASLMQGRKGVRSQGPVSRQREVVGGGRGRPGSFLPLFLAIGRAEGTDWEGACECPRSQMFYPQPLMRSLVRPLVPLPHLRPLRLPGFVVLWSYVPSSLGLLTDMSWLIPFS